ncbi:hypothetical protein [Bacillus sp. JJ1562]|uniref:hypothetical protein n=1 Tax=Bacillus sp. JJ1562 TaxID=3122960 RepID=UPI003002897C
MEWHRVNEQGQSIEVLSEYEESEFVVPGWEGSLCLPIYDFELKQWKEGLSPEELDQRRQELNVQPLSLEQVQAENELNALAIMELAEMILGG